MKIDTDKFYLSIIEKICVNILDTCFFMFNKNAIKISILRQKLKDRYVYKIS